jgi:hypothetical protein
MPAVVAVVQITYIILVEKAVLVEVVMEVDRMRLKRLRRALELQTQAAEVVVLVVMLLACILALAVQA